MYAVCDVGLGTVDDYFCHGVAQAIALPGLARGAAHRGGASANRERPLQTGLLLLLGTRGVETGVAFVTALELPSPFTVTISMPPSLCHTLTNAGATGKRGPRQSMRFDFNRT